MENNFSKCDKFDSATENLQKRRQNNALYESKREIFGKSKTKKDFVFDRNDKKQFYKITFSYH